MNATYISHDYGGVALSALSRALDEVDHSYAECSIGCAGKSEMMNTYFFCVYLKAIGEPGTLGKDNVTVSHL